MKRLIMGWGLGRKRGRGRGAAAAEAGFSLLTGCVPAARLWTVALLRLPLEVYVHLALTASIIKHIILLRKTR
jgi:hypothetical protein